jgi:tyrosyl-tRNA synthetase
MPESFPRRVVDILVKAGLAESKTVARRLIEQGGVKIDKERVEDIAAEVEAVVGERTLVQVGKKKWLWVKWS